MTTNLKRSPLAILRPAACVGLGLLIAAFGGCNGGGGGLVPSTPGGNPGGNPGGGDPGGGNPGGGNNPGGGTGGGPTNSGSYSMTEFNYQDPNPESYHPLGDAVFCMDREELAAFTDLYAAGASGLVMDDADHGHADVAPIMPMWPAGTLVFDAKGGQLDDDFRREIAVVGVYPPNPSSSSYQAFHTQVNVLATDAGGTLVQQSFFTAATDLVNASLELADVDGDGRDEILVAGGTGTRRVGAQQSFNTSGTRLRIFDDAVGGHLQLFDYT
ncbi:MAG TPA: hypothetical protein ENI87_03965, partial [bacterium]|nr:hypothetical protein [bacterium]